MLLIKEGKTNWKFLIIVFVLAAAAAVGILWWAVRQEISLVEVIKIPNIPVIYPDEQESSADRQFFAMGAIRDFMDSRIKPAYGGRGNLARAKSYLTDNAKEDYSKAQFIDFALLGISNPHFYRYEILKIEELDTNKLNFTVRIYERLTGEGEVGYFEEILTVIPVSEKYLIDSVKIGQRISKDDTAYWQTYRNEEAGFQIKYPNDWERTEAWERNGEGSEGNLFNLDEVSGGFLLRMPPYADAIIFIEYVTPTFTAGRGLSFGETITEVTKGEDWADNACFSDILSTYLISDGVLVSCAQRIIDGVDAIEYIRFTCSANYESCKNYVDVFEKVMILKIRNKKFSTLVFSTSMWITPFYSNTTEGKAKMEAIVEDLSNNTPTDIVYQEMIDQINNFDDLIKTVQILK